MQDYDTKWTELVEAIARECDTTLSEYVALRSGYPER